MNLGNIVTGDDTQTQYALDLHLCPALVALLSHKQQHIRKTAVWTLSNITAGTSGQIQLVIDAGAFPTLIELLQSCDASVQKWAVRAVSNATSEGTPEQIMYLVQQGAIPPLAALLSVSDNKIVTVALEGIKNTLKVGSLMVAAQHLQTNPIADIIEECGALPNIENLQNHENSDICNRAVKIIEMYFIGQDEALDDVDDMQPQDKGGV